MGGGDLPRTGHQKEQALHLPDPALLEESKQDIVQGLDSGADDYLTKPFDAEELKARLPAGQRILDLEDCLVAAREGSCDSRLLTISLLHFGIVA
jgi:CheY-like chemotaxis protein